MFNVVEVRKCDPVFPDPVEAEAYFQELHYLNLSRLRSVTESWRRRRAGVHRRAFIGRLPELRLQPPRWGDAFERRGG